MKRAILYARVSTDEQAENGYSLVTQFEAMQKYASQHGFKVINQIQDDCSGSIPMKERRGGNLLYKAINSQQVDVIIVYTIDRLSRDKSNYPIEFGLFYRDLEDAEVELHLTDRGKSNGDFFDMFEAWQAGEERRKIKERTMRGKRGKINAGRYPGYGRRPYGYDVLGKGPTTELVINEEEAEIIRLIFRWYATENVGVTEIAKKLSDMGPLAYGDKHEAGKLTKRGKWSQSQIYHILKKETYTGVWYAYRYKVVDGKSIRLPSSEWAPIDVPVIISQELWEAAQERLKQGRKMSIRNNSKNQYLMGRRLKCHCGYSMNGMPVRRRTRKYLYYACNGRSNKSVRDCTLPYYYVHQIDETVWQWVRSILLKPKKMLVGLRKTQEEIEQANLPLLEELEVVKGLIEVNKSKKERLLDLYLDSLDGSFDTEMLEHKKIELETESDALRQKKYELESTVETLVITDEQIVGFERFAEEVRDSLENEPDFDTRRELIDLLDVRGVVNDNETISVSCMAGRKVLRIDSTTSSRFIP
jgi:site-specific DNA recombinase